MNSRLQEWQNQAVGRNFVSLRGSSALGLCSGIALLFVLLIGAVKGTKGELGAALVPASEPSQTERKNFVSFSKCAPALADSIQAASGISPSRCLESSSRNEILIGFWRKGDPLAGHQRVALYLKNEQRLMEFGSQAFRVSYDAAWSLDGRKVAMTGTYQFVEPEEFYRDQVFVYELSNNKISQLGSVPGAAFQLAWSPDSSRLVAVVVASQDDIGDSPHGDGFLLEEGKDGAQRLTDGRSVKSPAWSPDGRSVALADESSPAILFFSSAGRLLRTLDLGILSSSRLSDIQQLGWLSDRRLLLHLGDFNGRSMENDQWLELRLQELPQGYPAEDTKPLHR